jgi:hypothetical protein
MPSQVTGPVRVTRSFEHARFAGVRAPPCALRWSSQRRRGHGKRITRPQTLIPVMPSSRWLWEPDAQPTILVSIACPPKSLPAAQITDSCCSSTALTPTNVQSRSHSSPCLCASVRSFAEGQSEAVTGHRKWIAHQRNARCRAPVDGIVIRSARRRFDATVNTIWFHCRFDVRHVNVCNREIILQLLHDVR